jgi:hypothetical protein
MSRTELLQVMTSWDPPIQAGSLFPYQTPLTWLYGSCMWQLPTLSECDDMSLWGQLCETRARFARAGFFNLKELTKKHWQHSLVKTDQSPSVRFVPATPADSNGRALAVKRFLFFWLDFNVRLGARPRRIRTYLHFVYKWWKCGFIKRIWKMKLG